MATMLNGRVFTSPSLLYRSFPKVLLLRSASSGSSKNSNDTNVSTSSLVEVQKHPTEGTERKTESADFVSQEVKKQENALDSKELPSKVVQNGKSGSLRASSLRENLKNLGSKPNLESVEKLIIGEKLEKDVDTKEQTEPPERIEPRLKTLGKNFLHGGVGDKKYNKIVQELADEEAEWKLKSGGSSSLLDSLKSVEGIGNGDMKSYLEKSIEETRSRKRKKFGETLLSSKSKSLPQKSERKWVERNLEDLEKSLSKPELSQSKSDPELNNKIKDILSELKVAPKQLGTAKTIVAAVENWGKTSFNLSQNIMDEYNEQTEESQTKLAEFSLKEGNRLGLFDGILNDAKAKNLKIHQDTNTFLMQSDLLEEADKIHQIGVYQNAFRDEINLSDKLWQYPVDNEVCKVEEEGISFEEHVFLEYLLDDFPSKGPVRRFMELVINGLQKNPHLTVEMKKERVGWFKNYFRDFSEEELNF